MTIDEILEKILTHEVHFHFCKSWGHWGQNVNKRKTKAELYFNVADSHFLDEEQKDLIVDNAWNRIHHHEKILIMTCQEERYQHANKKKVIHHFRQFMKESLHVDIPRVSTKIPKTVKNKRKEKKIQHAEKKKRRKNDIDMN